jgi:hypothetical protein
MYLCLSGQGVSGLLARKEEPFSWPPHFPDLTPPDSPFWGFVKDIITKKKKKKKKFKM